MKQFITTFFFNKNCYIIVIFIKHIVSKMEKVAYPWLRVEKTHFTIWSLKVHTKQSKAYERISMCLSIFNMHNDRVQHLRVSGSIFKCSINVNSWNQRTYIWNKWEIFICFCKQKWVCKNETLHKTFFL